jgi:hypothetical protein
MNKFLSCDCKYKICVGTHSSSEDHTIDCQVKASCKECGAEISMYGISTEHKLRCSMVPKCVYCGARLDCNINSHYLHCVLFTHSQGSFDFSM